MGTCIQSALVYNMTLIVIKINLGETFALTLCVQVLCLAEICLANNAPKALGRVIGLAMPSNLTPYTQQY